MNLPPSNSVTDAASAIALTHDSFLGGRLHLAQPAKGHRAGTDAVLLAAIVPSTAGLVVDVGAGVGTVGLALALRNRAARMILLERDPVFAALARRNVIANDMGDRVTVAESNVLSARARRDAGIENDSADAVVTNPPFHDPAIGRRASHALKRNAHVMEGELGTWLRACLAIMRSGGALSLVHRADALPAILMALSPGAGAITVRPVHARRETAAIRVLVNAVKGSRRPLELLMPLVLHDETGTFTKTTAALHEGRTTLTT